MDQAHTSRLAELKAVENPDKDQLEEIRLIEQHQAEEAAKPAEAAPVAAPAPEATPVAAEPQAPVVEGEAGQQPAA